MFYKFENEEWMVANEVHFPNGLKLTMQNKEEVDGWKWYNQAPQAYLDWVAIKEL